MKVLNLVLEDLTLERNKIKKLKEQLTSINDTNNNILLWSSYMDGLDKKSE